MTAKREAISSELAALSREQLIERILAHEAASDVLRNNKLAKKARRANKPFDFDAYPKMHVAMKVAYLGWDYHGYASQISFKPGAQTGDMSIMSDRPTVEEHLFRAMMTSKLIQNPTTANYSRCGRTDAGVSSTGQVIGATIRCSGEKTTTTTLSLPVAIMLNSLLPPEIRILDVTAAPDGFNSRFDCKYRMYHYYFPRHGLDIAAMQESAALLLGEHDFRNFCKRDPSKEITNYVRTILESRIEPVSEGPFQMYRYVIKGTAFLYHQVRCTMALLFLVGSGKESPEIISYLLNHLDEEWRPTYQMASEIPLVLVDCGFDKIKFEKSCPDAEMKTQKHFFGLWKDRIAQALTLQSLLDPEHPYVEPSSKVHIKLRQ